MKIAITGAGGFLGRNLIKKCTAYNDMSIVAITSNKELLSQNYKKIDSISVVGVDELKEIDWSSIDILLNCAFPRNNDGEQMAQGLEFITELLLTAKRGGVAAVINISSQSVYSQTRMEAAKEETTLNLESKYAVGKYAIELITNSVCKNIPHTNLRMASLIGVGFEQRITNKLVLQVIDGNDLNIVGGEQKFGFLDIRDAVDGIFSIFNSNPKEWKETYNLGTNESYSLEEIAKQVAKVGEQYLGKKVCIRYEKSSEWKNSSMICDKFFEAFSWNPKYTVKDTIQTLFEFYQIKKN